MKLRVILLATLFVFTKQLIAQNDTNKPYSVGASADLKHTLKGQVIDKQSGAPLEYATIAVLNPADSSVISGGISNTSGEFSIKSRTGQVIVDVHFISYEHHYHNLIINPNQLVYDLGELGLKSNASELEEVVVTGQKDQVEFSLDKRIFNVSDNVSNVGKNAADILDNIPSVQVDIEGNVSLRGNDNVNILIDGKPSGLVGISSQDALRQLQGNMIETIEVVTNPSARYDAEGSAGIINIILKKEARKGMNGSFSFNAGHPSNYNLSLNMNYRSGKFNYFVSGGVNYRRNNGKGYSRQEFFGDSPLITIRDRTHSRGGWSKNIRMGADYHFTEKSILTGALLLKSSDESNTTNINFLDAELDGTVRDEQLRTDNEKETEGYTEFSLNYKKEFENKDHTLTFYSQFRDNGEIENSNILHQYLIDDLDTLQKVLNDEGEKNYLFQVDYIHPFSKSHKFELGLKTNIRHIKNDYLVRQYDNVDVWETLDEFSSDFEYDENIHAAYGMYGNKSGRLSYQGGLRIEYTDIMTNLITFNEVNQKKYVNLFPSAQVTYQVGEGRDVQISYSKRMRRPWFRLLNPFSSFSDNRNIRTGNPDLDPELTDSYEIGYLMNWENSSVYGGVYYNYSTNVIRRISRYIEDEEGSYIVSQPYNLANRDSYGIELTLSKDFTDWFKANGNFNFYRSVTDGSIFFDEEEMTLHADAKSWSARVNSTVTLPGAIDFQANVNYRGPQNTTQGRRLAFYTVDLGFTKDILKQKGTLTATVQDLFNTRKWRNERVTDTFIDKGEFQWRARQFRLSFVYRLNQKKMGGRRGRGGAGGPGNDGGGDL